MFKNIRLQLIGMKLEDIITSVSQGFAFVTARTFGTQSPHILCGRLRHAEEHWNIATSSLSLVKPEEIVTIFRYVS